jgi:hypothetical protein
VRVGKPSGRRPGRENASLWQYGWTRRVPAQQGGQLDDTFATLRRGHLHLNAVSTNRWCRRRSLGARTTIVVADRLCTIQPADEIIVLGEVRLMEQGRQEELLQRAACTPDWFSRQWLPPWPPEPFSGSAPGKPGARPVATPHSAPADSIFVPRKQREGLIALFSAQAQKMGLPGDWMSGGRGGGLCRLTGLLDSVSTPSLARATTDGGVRLLADRLTLAAGA